MTGSEKPHEASGGTPSEKRPKTVPKTRKFDPKKAWIVAPDGDLVLYTPGKAFGVLKTIPDAGDAGFLVSSAHLKLSSKYFKTLLSARWSEGRASAAGDPIQVEINDCQPGTLYLILNIIHGRTRSVPREISLETLAELSIAVDFLQCEEVVEFHAQMWIQSLKPQVPTSWSPMVPTWLMISCVFNDKDIQSKTMELASEEGTAPFATNGLPIPRSIKGMSVNMNDNSRPRPNQSFHQFRQDRPGKRIIPIKRLACCREAHLQSPLNEGLLYPQMQRSVSGDFDDQAGRTQDIISTNSCVRVLSLEVHHYPTHRTEPLNDPLHGNTG